MPQRLLRVEELITVPLAVAGLLLLVGAFGFALGQPWLVPSLAPTAYLLVKEPQLDMSRPYNVIVSHLLALGAGIAVFALFGLESGQSLWGGDGLSAEQLWASIVAVAVVELGALLVRASHAPAGSTALIVTLSGFELGWHDALSILAGIIVLAATGEAVRHARLRQLERVERMTQRSQRVQSQAASTARR